MKKIFITIGKLDRGGAEMRLLKLISDLNKINIKACYYIYVVSGRKGVLTDEFMVQDNLRIIYGKTGVIGLRLFFKTLKKINPDILHINASLAGGVYALVGKLASTENIFCHIRTTEHYGYGFLYTIKQLLYRILLNTFSTKVVGVCDGAQRLSNTPNDKWKTIYNGVDVFSLDFLKTKQLDYSIVCLGRMHEAKNQIFLIEVIKDLLDFRPEINWQLYFYGKENTTLKMEMINKVEELKISHHINFCGETQEPLEELKKFKLLVLPSIREGLPGVVLEALSVGCESLVSDLDGCKEIARQIPYVHIVEGYESRKWAISIARYFNNYDDTKRIMIHKSIEKSDFKNINHIRKICDLWGLVYEKNE